MLLLSRFRFRPMNTMRLDGKVAIVTGASEGIGAALVHALRDRGAKLVVTARSEDKLRSVAGSDAVTVAGDLTQEATREAVIGRAMERFGRIDVLINNAGVGLYAPSHTTPLQEARRLWELNFFAPLDMIQRAAVHMKQQRSGTIVNVGSIAGKMTLPWFSLYSASKYAIGSLTDGLRMELRSFGIHTMTVCPGIREHALSIERDCRRASTAGRRGATMGDLARTMREGYRATASNPANARWSLPRQGGS